MTKVKSLRYPLTGLVGTTLMGMSSMAAAVPVSATLEMVCPFPLIGDQTIIAQISAEAPEVIDLSDNPVVAPILINTITTVPDKARQGLAFVGAETITGKVISSNSVRSASGQEAINADLDIVPTTIPAGESGPFDVPADGFTPEFTFNESHIGTVSITVDDLVLDLTNYKADGTVAPAPVGQFVADCTVVAGQDTTLATIEVIPGGGAQLPADILVEPASLDFGVLQLGQTATQSVTISNVGDLDLGINGISIIGAGAGSFVENNACTVIAGKSDCVVDVTYTASVEGVQNAQLVISSTDEDEGTVPVDLTGTGQVELTPEIELSTNALDFGVIVEGNNKTETLTVTNSGGAALTISSVTVSGSEFALSGNECATVPAGQTCDIEVTYSAVVGASSGALTISSDEDEAELTVRLSGVGEEEVIIDPRLEIALDVEGTSYIKASRANLPLQGDLVALIDLVSGYFTADMVLAPTQGKFEIIQGWSRYMATADVEFESVGITEGSLVDGKLTATYTAYIKVPKVTKTMFGLVNWKIGGGSDCRTKEPVTFTVESPEGETFGPLTGGRVVGTYTLPKLEKCGLLTEILNLKMAGSGNTIDMQMVPRL